MKKKIFNLILFFLSISALLCGIILFAVGDYSKIVDVFLEILAAIGGAGVSAEITLQITIHHFQYYSIKQKQINNTNIKQSQKGGDGSNLSQVGEIHDDR